MSININELKKIIEDHGIIFPKENIPKKLIEILNNKNVVILGEFHHYIKQHQEFLFNLSKGLHQFEFQQVFVEGIHAYSWMIEDYATGKIDLFPKNIRCFNLEFLEQIREFNKDLPEKDKIIVKDIDMTHGDNSFVESVTLMSEVIDTHGLFDDLDSKSDKYHEQLTNLKNNLPNYKVKFTDKWYERIEKMIEVEKKSFKIRKDELYYEEREKVMIDLCKKNLSGNKKTIMLIGHNHAQKKHFEGTGEDYQLLGEFVNENYNSYHIGLIGIKGEIKYSFKDLETKKFDVLKDGKEDDLFRIIGEIQKDNNIFLPLNNSIFENEFMVMDGLDENEVKPKIQFDAYVSFPEVSLNIDA